MVFQTTVVLPEVATRDAPLFVRGFEIDAPNFVYRFADMNEKVHFGSLVLRGSNEPVDVKVSAPRFAFLDLFLTPFYSRLLSH